MRRVALLAAATLAAALLLAPGADAAPFALNSFDVTFTDPNGKTVDQAGAHPYKMTTSFKVDKHPSGKGGFFPEEALRDAIFTQVPGFIGSPTAVPTCSAAEFLTQTSNPEGAHISSCKDSAAIGVIKIELASALVQEPVYAAVYNLDHSPGKAAKLGFWAGSVPVTVDAELSEEAPNQIVAASTDIPQLVEVVGTEFTLWGVPADPGHDAERGLCLKGTGGSTGPCHVSVPEVPFLTMPRACHGPLHSSYTARSWPGSLDSGEAFTHEEAGNPHGMVGCGALGFDPEISAVPTSRQAASPSGLDLALHLDQGGLSNPDGVAASDIEKATLTLPEGVTLNPSQAEGLATCSQAQADRETAGSAFGAACPAESKVGSVEVESPLVEHEILHGSLFVATPYANPFGSLLALYMTVKDPSRGVGILLAGKLEADPTSGRLVATFGSDGQELPQAPISDLRVHLSEGSRSPLITPGHCGPYTTEMLLTPTADPAHPRSATSTFQVGSGPGGGPCPPAGAPPFEPGFEAGTLANGAATHSPFTMRLTRRDGDQDLTRFAATLPPGVLASLVGVGKCSDAAIASARARTGPNGGHEELAAPSCPADSKIGTTLAGAGVGQELTYVPGSLYLAGPFNGAPLSVVSITPGVAGPFDVGTIVVRVALDFNSRSARAIADGSRSDPIPHILRGIPLAVRDLRVSVDRPNWIFNPTSCRESSTEATLFGSGADFFSPADDVGVARQARFQAADCKVLAFSPRLSLGLSGGTSRGDFPALTATYRPRSGDANLRNLSLLFPRSEFIENAHFRTICTRVQYAAHKCPKGSVYGHAKVVTPLLAEPLKGPVYLRSSDHLLPDAVLALHGIIDVEVPVRIDSKKKRLRATIANAPDAPITMGVVHMQGGEKGLFVNSRGLCAGRNNVATSLTAQSAKKLERHPALQAKGCPSHRHR